MHRGTSRRSSLPARKTGLYWALAVGPWTHTDPAYDAIACFGCWPRELTDRGRVRRSAHRWDRCRGRKPRRRRIDRLAVTTGRNRQPRARAEIGRSRVTARPGTETTRTSD